MKAKLYYVATDRQGTSWATGIYLTAEEWRQRALDWAENDANDAYVTELKNLEGADDDRILSFIDENWDIEFASGGKEAEQLREAYAEARHQAACHEQQVSGCWSIDGRKFVKKYGLDYDKALDAQFDADSEDLANLQSETLAKIMRYVELTEEQIEQVFEKVESEFYFDGESWAFWNSLMSQIEKKLADLGEEL